MVDTKPPANPLFLRDEELRQGIELMFSAYRDFTFESDQQLKRYQLGRAHHRALYFIGRHPGQTVGHLLSILKVTKQSISRVLKDLLEQLDAEHFAQVHRSVVVNLRAISHVKRHDNETAEIHLKGRDDVLPVSRNYLHLFRQM